MRVVANVDGDAVTIVIIAVGALGRVIALHLSEQNETDIDRQSKTELIRGVSQ